MGAICWNSSGWIILSAFSGIHFCEFPVQYLLYCIGTVPLTLIVALTLAVLLNQKIRGRSVFRVVSCIPYVSSIIAVTTVWRMIFHPAKGPVNAPLLYYAFQVPKGDLPQWFTGHLIIMSYILFFSVEVHGILHGNLSGGTGESRGTVQAGNLDRERTAGRSFDILRGPSCVRLHFLLLSS